VLTKREAGALQRYLAFLVRKLENSESDKYLVIALGWTGVISKPLIADEEVTWLRGANSSR
jgi:hypothetical protein